jgi:hypothetical protein
MRDGTTSLKIPTAHTNTKAITCTILYMQDKKMGDGTTSFKTPTTHTNARAITYTKEHMQDKEVGHGTTSLTKKRLLTRKHRKTIHLH